MRTLVIDTATRACSVALFDDENVIAAAYEVIGRGHAERLLPLIAALPDNGKADRVMVNVGPGSFTGIRVGVAAAKALGLAWHIDVHGYGCLALVAAMARSQLAEPAPIDVVMTGGHGEYFFEAFDAQGHSLAPVRSVLPADLLSLATANVVAGDIDDDQVIAAAVAARPRSVRVNTLKTTVAAAVAALRVELKGAPV
jgi:tRNA threonylcarbamoyl adenosine modification protein YeaZ